MNGVLSKVFRYRWTPLVMKGNPAFESRSPRSWRAPPLYISVYPMKYITFFLLFTFSAHGFATELSLTSRLEIAHLFSYLENSGCQFNRNGSWYQPKEAVAHINKKYQHLLGKGLIHSTEVFIDKAAAESSMSNKPYLVKCNNGTAVESATWFKTELSRYRIVSGTNR